MSSDLVLGFYQTAFSLPPLPAPFCFVFSNKLFIFLPTSVSLHFGVQNPPKLNTVYVIKGNNMCQNMYEVDLI